MGPRVSYFFEVWWPSTVRIGQRPTITANFVLSKMLTAVFVILASRYFRTTCEVEAAGIEPASRDVSMKASTCVADSLGFRLTDPCRPGSNQTSREQGFNSERARHGPERSGFGGRFLGFSG